jgi:hypothetical protein
MNKTLLPLSQLETPKFAKLRLLARVSSACRVVRILNGPFLGNEHPMWIWTNRMRFRFKVRTRLGQTLRIG